MSVAFSFWNIQCQTATMVLGVSNTKGDECLSMWLIAVQTAWKQRTVGVQHLRTFLHVFFYFIVYSPWAEMPLSLFWIIYRVVQKKYNIRALFCALYTFFCSTLYLPSVY